MYGDTAGNIVDKKFVERNQNLFFQEKTRLPIVLSTA
jgi:hypothetical protein